MVADAGWRKGLSPKGTDPVVAGWQKGLSPKGTDPVGGRYGNSPPPPSPPWSPDPELSAFAGRLVSSTLTVFLSFPR